MDTQYLHNITNISKGKVSDLLLAVEDVIRTLDLGGARVHITPLVYDDIDAYWALMRPEGSETTKDPIKGIFITAVSAEYGTGVASAGRQLRRERLVTVEINIDFQVDNSGERKLYFEQMNLAEEIELQVITAGVLIPAFK